jgi:AcrR family transcriptional regulator
MQIMNGRSPSDVKGSSLRSRLREATGAAILDAAEEVFADKGLHAAHMNDIAARAGVAVGTLYNHFKDRDALLDALMRERREGMMQVIDDFLELPSSGVFREDLSALMKRMGGFLDHHRRFHHILHQCDLGAGLSAYPVTAASSAEMKRLMYERLDVIMQRGVEQKALRPELAAYYSSILMGVLRSARQQQRELGSEHLPVEEIVRFFMEGAGA